MRIFYDTEFLDDPAIVRAFAKHGITWPEED